MPREKSKKAHARAQGDAQARRRAPFYPFFQTSKVQCLAIRMEFEIMRGHASDLDPTSGKVPEGAGDFNYWFKNVCSIDFPKDLNVATPKETRQVLEDFYTGKRTPFIVFTRDYRHMSAQDDRLRSLAKPRALKRAGGVKDFTLTAQLMLNEPYTPDERIYLSDLSLRLLDHAVEKGLAQPDSKDVRNLRLHASIMIVRKAFERWVSGKSDLFPQPAGEIGLPINDVNKLLTAGCKQIEDMCKTSEEELIALAQTIRDGLGFCGTLSQEVTTTMLRRLIPRDDEAGGQEPSEPSQPLWVPCQDRSQLEDRLTDPLVLRRVSEGRTRDENLKPTAILVRRESDTRGDPGGFAEIQEKIMQLVSLGNALPKKKKLNVEARPRKQARKLRLTH